MVVGAGAFSRIACKSPLVRPKAVFVPSNSQTARVQFRDLFSGTRFLQGCSLAGLSSKCLLAASAADRYPPRTRRSATLVIVESLNACFAIQAGLLPVGQLAIFVDELVTLRVGEPWNDRQAGGAYLRVNWLINNWAQRGHQGHGANPEKVRP